MKELIRETKSTYIIYQAIDGTEFNNKEECKKYEDTAKCLLLTKYRPLVKKTVSEIDVFNTGSDEYMVDILQCLRDEADIDVLIQLHRLYNSSRNNNDDFYNNLRSKLEKCFEDKDIIIIGRGTSYDNYDNFYVLTTLQEISNNITRYI